MRRLIQIVYEIVPDRVYLESLINFWLWKLLLLAKNTDYHHDPLNYWTIKKTIKKLVGLQLNEYETAPYLIQFSRNLTCDCLLISVFPPNLPELNLKLFWTSEQNNFRFSSGKFREKWWKTHNLMSSFGLKEKDMDLSPIYKLRHSNSMSCIQYSVPVENQIVQLFTMYSYISIIAKKSTSF